MPKQHTRSRHEQGAMVLAPIPDIVLDPIRDALLKKQKKMNMLISDPCIYFHTWRERAGSS
jgi:hypothetical protein